ncbi:bacterial lysin [Planococcus antarcticus DSM 14505]|uniref:Bacterial lysin n=1 Tax=Planococcus antarcticus DSM 14505 TaxID=1185653 RepID=A0AA87INY9_9BACL|nr:glycoside hydrolase domain-containing protein [Planococcus antarcticus]EIM08330.1 bacterial lysin [Planococcus antarcticus DSM 14505]
MDPRVLEVQTWVNANYFAVPGYSLAPVTGKTGWSTMYSLTMALQHELGISPVIESFGPSTMAAYKAYGELTQGNVPNNQKGERIVYIIQGACWCKGYNPGGFNGVFGSETKRAISDLQKDANLPITDGKVYDYIFKALLSMDAYVLTPGGDPKIQMMQRDLNNKYFRTSGVQPTDGHYQRGTNRALIYGIQTEQGIPASQQTGSAGPTTRDRLPLLQYGNSGVFVKFFQYALYVNNYDTGSFDGIFGRGTQNVVKEFQGFVKLTPDGYVGKSTWLSALVSTGDPSRKGTASDCITEITPARAQSLINSGYETVGRYLVNVPGGLNKKIQPGEIQTILNAGLSIFPIFQTFGNGISYFNSERGRTDAIEAYQAAKSFGFKKDTIIYFAVDFDALGGDIPGSVVPYFKAINSQLSLMGSPYKVGVYGARNVCIQVSEAGAAVTSFVSGMSTGFSGNLGYPLPSNWAFDQISTISIGSGDGYINIDNNIKSGKDNGQFSVGEVPKALNEDCFNQMQSIWDVAIEYVNEHMDGDLSKVSYLTANYYRKGKYVGGIWDLTVGAFNNEFYEYVNQALSMTIDDIIPLIDPLTGEDNDLPHLLAGAQAIAEFPDIPIISTHIRDYAAWAGDLYTSVADILAISDSYEGDRFDQVYKASMDVIASTSVPSSFGYSDYISDIDGLIIGERLAKSGSIPLVDLFRDYYTNDVSKRYQLFYETKFDSDRDEITQQAYQYLMGGGDLLAARYLISRSLANPIPGYDLQDANAISLAFRDKLLEYIEEYK